MGAVLRGEERVREAFEGPFPLNEQGSSAYPLQSGWFVSMEKSWSKSVQNFQMGYDSFRFLDFNVRNKFMKGSFDWVKWDRTPHRIVLCFVLFPLCALNFQGWWVKTLRRDQRSWWKKSCSNWDIWKRWHSPYQIMQWLSIYSGDGEMISPMKYLAWVSFYPLHQTHQISWIESYNFRSQCFSSWWDHLM